MAGEVRRGVPKGYFVRRMTTALKSFIDGNALPVAGLIYLLLALAGARTGGAQVLETQSSELTVDDQAMSNSRLRQLRGAPTDGFLLRSTSSLLEHTDTTGIPGWRRLSPSARFIFNTGMPVSANDGPLWAGRGPSTITTFGARYARGRLRVVIAPQLVLASNSDWHVRDTVVFWSPHPAPARASRAYTFSWYQGQFSIDLPLRYGDRAVRIIDPGQSSIYLKLGRTDVGAGTENQWWGPGIRNALVLSNTAPGFFHFFLRSGRPWQTRVGSVEWRWIVGGLAESRYFDAIPDNDLRSLSAAAVTLQPWFSRNLTLGASRSVMGTATGWGQVPLRWFEVFHGTDRTTEQLAWDDPGSPGGREQIMSLFFRYVMPAAGSEVYWEWGRTELPASLRDFLVAPNHTQGYTVGVQWSRPIAREGARFRVQGEITTLEQSATFRDRPIGTWYSSRRVVQGYTHRGQMLGAAIGPGSSAQWLALDYLAPAWALGAYGGRTRWNEDIHSVYNWPDYMQYCNHDVSVYGGVRAERQSRLGRVLGDLEISNRMTAYFQRAGCFPPTFRDIRNVGLKVTFIPNR